MKSFFFFQEISHNRTASSKQLRGGGEGRGRKAQKCTSACINHHHPAPKGLKHLSEQPIMHQSLQLLNQSVESHWLQQLICSPNPPPPVAAPWFLGA